MNAEKRKRLRELAENATPGPWEPCGCRFSIVTAQITPQETLDICDTKINDALSCEQAEANNCFIAAARSAVPELLDALERSERIASNLDAVNKAIYRSMSEICGVAVDGFSDIQPVLMGLRVDADLFYSIKAENAALRERVAVLETVREAAGALADELDRRAGGNDWPMDLGDYGDALTDALDKADKTDKEGA